MVRCLLLALNGQSDRAQVCPLLDYQQTEAGISSRRVGSE